MKKTIACIVAGTCLFGLTTGAFAQGAAAPAVPAAGEDTVAVQPEGKLVLSQLTGKITDVKTEGERASITVKPLDDAEEMIFHLSLEAVNGPTWVVDAETGLPASLDQRTNDNVIVYYGPMTTMSIPAQSPATVVIVNVTDEVTPPVYAEVEAVTTNADGNVVITTDNGSRLVTLPKEMDIRPWVTRNIVTTADVQVGSQLLLWYDVMALSYPAQATADRAAILAQLADEAAPAADAPQPVAGPQAVEMVPLRAIAEGKGYEVTWHNGSIVLVQGNSTVTLTVGEVEGGYNKMRLLLDAAPELRDGVTYVPANLFEQIEQ